MCACAVSLTLCTARVFSFDYLVDRPARVEPAGERGAGRPIVPEDRDGSREGDVRGGVVDERDGGGGFEGRGSFDERDARDASEERDTAGAREPVVDERERDVADDYDARDRRPVDDRERDERPVEDPPTPLETADYGDYYG